VSNVPVDDALERCEALLDVQRFDQALELASRAVALQPGDRRAYGLAARALMGLGRHEEAANAASQAVTHSPQWAYGYRLLAVALMGLAAKSGSLPGKDLYGQSVTAALESVRLAPTDPSGHATLAEAQSAAGQLTEADASIRRAVQIDPRRANTWVSASLVAIRARNWAAAEGAARRALAIDPANRSAMNNLGVALRRQGKWTVGAVAFHGAARIDPRSPTARDNLESIGFQYLANLVPLVILPLLIIWPLFVAARIAITQCLAHRPERLKPLARRLGLRVATNDRYRQKFEKQNARAQMVLASGQSQADWSALRGRQHVSSDFLMVLAVCLALSGLVFTVAAALAGSIAGALTVAVVFGAGAGLLFRAVARRRRRI
jgi:tetratricopeptide (TPR) repeat protein